MTRGKWRQTMAKQIEENMTLHQKIINEIRSVALATLYFAAWLGLLVGIKKLILAEYQIEFQGLSMALVGALVLGKVALVLEHVPLGSWVANRPVFFNVLVRTVLYASGVFVVLLLEKGFEGRHAYGGFHASLVAVFEHADGYHVWANVIVVFAALLIYNALSVLRQHLGEGELIRLFLRPSPNQRDRSL